QQPAAQLEARAVALHQLEVERGRRAAEVIAAGEQIPVRVRRDDEVEVGLRTLIAREQRRVASVLLRGGVERGDAHLQVDELAHQARELVLEDVLQRRVRRRRTAG